jgi:hypothetical protein
MTLEKDVHFVRAYAAQQLMGLLNPTDFYAYIDKYPIPSIFDGERTLYLVDHRREHHGVGGKFCANNSRGIIRFPGWKKHMINAPGEPIFIPEKGKSLADWIREAELEREGLPEWMRLV